MQTLAQIYDKHRVNRDTGSGDKGSIHSYIDTYEKLLAPYRAHCTLMEIGIARGLSLLMWREYMPSSIIVGVDISMVLNQKEQTDAGNILIQADATKPPFLNLIRDYRFDVIIDDASHVCGDQMITFNMLKPKMKPGGIYVIEDILDLNGSEKTFRNLHEPMEVFDFRKTKGRFDDVLIVYKF